MKGKYPNELSGNPQAQSNAQKNDGITQFYNCFILRNHEIFKDDLWVHNGIIIDPEDLFYNKRVLPQVRIDCLGALICPGFIDVQINGE